MLDFCLLSTIPQIFSDEDQFGQRMGTHFSHYTTAVNLHCHFANAHLASDLLVHEAARHQRHHLAFAEVKDTNLARTSALDFSSLRRFRSRSIAPLTASNLS